MVKIWLLNESVKDKNSECHYDPPIYLNESCLKEIGVYLRNIKDLEEVVRIGRERGYDRFDEFSISFDKLSKDEMDAISNEHLHVQEQIRYVLEGKGYFDYRNINDEWIRVEPGPGDFIILPPGCYHRFHSEFNDYIKVFRMFKNEPEWEAFYRSDETDQLPGRVNYLKTIHKTPNHCQTQ